MRDEDGNKFPDIDGFLTDIFPPGTTDKQRFMLFRGDVTTVILFLMEQCAGGGMEGV